MKIVVTGGAGMIGSALVKRLLEQGHQVVVFDNMSSGSKRNLPTPGLNLRIYEGDIRTGHHVNNVIDADVDIVFHLASHVGVRQYIEKPVDTIATSVMGSNNVFMQAAILDIPVVYASTSEVYGNGTIPMKEGDPLTYGSTERSRWCYGMSKAVVEHLAEGYHRQFRLRVMGLRYFNIVGAAQASTYGFVLPTFVEQALRNEPITVHAPGSQIRTFLHVSDAVEATLRLGWMILGTPDEWPVTHGVYNVGNPNAVNTMLGLAQYVKEVTGSTSDVVLVSPEQEYGDGFDHIYDRIPDMSRTKTLIDFQPKMSLEDIIQEIAAERLSRVGAGV